jgi:hypothetical protein
MVYSRSSARNVTAPSGEFYSFFPLIQGPQRAQPDICSARWPFRTVSRMFGDFYLQSGGHNVSLGEFFSAGNNMAVYR